MLQLITELANGYGKSIVLSSHILSDVEQVCEHVVLLERGKVLDAGSVKDLTSHETRALNLVLVGDPDALCDALTKLSGHEVKSTDGRYRVTIAEEISSARVFRPTISTVFQSDSYTTAPTS